MGWLNLPHSLTQLIGSSTKHRELEMWHSDDSHNTRESGKTDCTGHGNKAELYATIRSWVRGKHRTQTRSNA